MKNLFLALFLILITPLVGNAQSAQCLDLFVAENALELEELTQDLLATGLQQQAVDSIMRYPVLADTIADRHRHLHRTYERRRQNLGTILHADSYTIVARGIKLENLYDFDPNYLLYRADGQGRIDAAALVDLDVAKSFAQGSKEKPYGILITYRIPTAILRPSRSENHTINTRDLLAYGIVDLTPLIQRIDIQMWSENSEKN